MEIKINKEIRDYKESVFMGLTLRQCLFSLAAVGVALGLYFGLRNILGKEAVSWLCIVGAFPFAALGFVRYHGMPAEQLLAAYVVSQWLMPRELVSRPVNLYADMLKGEGRKKKDQAWEVLDID